jgi:excisionase family DNA binding protein
MSVAPADFHTVPEIARELRVSPRTIYRAIERGDLLAVRLGETGRLRVAGDSIAEFLRPTERKRPTE